MRKVHIPKVIITLAIALFILVALTQNYKNRQISSPFAQEVITHPSSPSTSAKIELQPVIFNQEHQNRKLFGTFVKGRVIVKLASALQLQTDSENPLVPIDTLSDTTTQNSSFKSLLDSLQFQSITPLSHATKSNIQNVYILDGTQLDVMSAIQSLKQSPLVMIAQPDYYLYTDQSPINEPFLNDREPPAHERQLPEFQGSWNQDFDFQWNLKTIGINKDTDFTQQKEVVVAVLDSGVDYNHTELRDNMWINRSENPSNRRDDDGNGFVDDYRGWDALDFIARVEDRDFRIQPDNDPMDNATESYFQAANVRVGGGHGTAVAGIIGGRINNYGMIGINPHAKIMPLRVCDASGICPSSAIIQMLEYAIDKKVDVINMSFGRNEPDEITQNLVKEAYKKGIVLIAAAGNDGNSKANHYPADYNEVVSVSAVEPNDSISNYSHVSENVDISAPASFVVTPRGSQTDMACVFSSDCNFRKVDHSWVVIGQNLDFTVFSGTSSSSPHVAAAASLIKGKHPSLSNKEIIHILLNSADDLGAPGFDPQFGYGRLHLQKALSEMNTSQPSKGSKQVIIPTPTFTPTPTPFTRTWELSVTTACEPDNQPTWRNYTYDATVLSEQQGSYDIAAKSSSSVEHRLFVRSTEPDRNYFITLDSNKLSTLPSLVQYQPSLHNVPTAQILRDPSRPTFVPEQKVLSWSSQNVPSGKYTVQFSPMGGEDVCSQRHWEVKTNLICKNDNRVVNDSIVDGHFKAVFVQWPPNPIQPKLEPLTKYNNSVVTLASQSRQNHIYVSLIYARGTYLKLLGTSPHPAITYGTAFGYEKPTASWYAGDLLNTQENEPIQLNFEAPSFLCNATQAPIEVQTNYTDEEILNNLSLTVSNAPSQRIPEDLNDDGIVNILDISIVISTYGQETDEGDVNGDRIVNSLDFTRIIAKL